MKNIEEAIQYLSARRGDNLSYRIELNLLMRLKHELEWGKLTSEEKQDKRKEMLDLANKNIEAEYTDGYLLQKACYDYYKNCLFILKNIEKHITSIYLKRLEILIRIDMETLDQELHLRCKKIIPYNVYEYLFIEIQQSGVYINEQNDFLSNNYAINNSFLP